jgi:hypothetical protein
MSAGLRAAIIAVREFPPVNGKDGKALAEQEPKKVRMRHEARGALMSRQGSGGVTV